ncbi:MAG: diguanylate cyclase domain-containing protein [Nitrospiria bacterium]
MNENPAQKIGEPYLLALKDYLSGGGEAALKQAYDLGRQAVADRLGVLEMVTVHEEAMGAILSDFGQLKENRKAVQVAQFLAESLSPFEMVQRGLHEAYDTLLTLNKTLKSQNEELGRLLNILDASLNEIYMFDPKTLRFLYANSRVLQNLGCSPEAVRTKTPLDMNSECDEPRFRSFIAPLMERSKEKMVLQTQHRRKDGSVYPVEEHLQLIEQGPEQICLAVTLDLTERKQMETLSYLAYHDNLTALPNRLLFNDRLLHSIQAGRRDGLSFAVILLDLNRFKEVNDTLGHAKGDIVLQQCGPRMHGVLRDSDTLARLGGDEFGILLDHTSVDGAVLAAKKISEAFERPFVVDQIPFEIGASIGISIFPWHGETAELLMRRADAAMYAAKQFHRGYKIYSPDCDSCYKKKSSRGGVGLRQ